jgi:hypothetical protein
MSTSLSPKQAALLADSVVDADGKLDYQAFLEEFGGTTEHKVMTRDRRESQGDRRARAASGKRKHLLVPPSSTPVDTKPAFAGIEMPLMTCLLGFLCFPLWCCGVRWFNDPDKRRRMYGRASVTLLCLFFVVLCGVGMGMLLMMLNSDESPAAGNAAHCTPMMMVGRQY